MTKPRELLSYFSSTIHAAFARVWRASRFDAEAGMWRAVDQTGRAELSGYFDALETLARDGWLVGGRYSIADPYLIVFYRWGARTGADMAAYPAWTAHKDRLLARPAVRRALAAEEIVVE